MPGVAVVVVFSLGVGIGVNTAVFSWIQAFLLKPIPAVERSACRGPSIAISRRGCRPSRS
jgi:hypothetical protein